MTQKTSKKHNATNVALTITVALIIAALIVADKTVGMILMAIAVGIVVFMAVLSADFRGKF